MKWISLLAALLLFGCSYPGRNECNVLALEYRARIKVALPESNPRVLALYSQEAGHAVTVYETPDSTVVQVPYAGAFYFAGTDIPTYTLMTLLNKRLHRHYTWAVWVL